MEGLVRAALYACALLMACPAMAQTADRLARGRYLVESIAGCGNCHTPKGPNGDLPGMALAGGQVFDEQPFRAVASNITPDPETGIGRWTDAQIARAIREGVRPDGRIIGPPMPFELYRGISDDDLAAMVAYLRSVPAVRNAVPASEYRIPLPPAYGPPVASVPNPPANDRLARGAYLAGPLGHCVECHTPMTPAGQRDWARTGAGGAALQRPLGDFCRAQHHARPRAWHRRLDGCADHPRRDAGRVRGWTAALPAHGLWLLCADDADRS